MDNQIQLADVIFVDNEYSLKHPHMIHRHENVLELLYIAEESGRYIVGDYEYAVTAGDFVARRKKFRCELVARNLSNVSREEKLLQGLSLFGVGHFFMLREKISERDENLTKKTLRAKIESLNIILSMAQGFFHI